MKILLYTLTLLFLINGRVLASERDYYALTQAIFEQDTYRLEQLLKSGADPNLMVGDNALSRPLLNEAIRYGKDKKIQLVEALLRYGANPNLIPPNKYSILVLTTAITNGYEDSLSLIKLLLFHGADPNLRNGEAICVSSSNFEILKILLQSGGGANIICSGQNLLHLSASRSDHYDSIKYFIDRGFDIIGIDDHANTALHLAIKRHGLWQFPTTSIISNLLHLGADMNLKNNDGFSALEILQNIMTMNCSGGRFETQEICEKEKLEANWVHEYIFKQYM